LKKQLAATSSATGWTDVGIGLAGTVSNWIRDFSVLDLATAEAKGGEDLFVFKADCFWATSFV
jgi:hypothetical protein